jgi:hypothetical protein
MVIICPLLDPELFVLLRTGIIFQGPETDINPFSVGKLGLNIA